jgi:hypothetical protein
MSKSSGLGARLFIHGYDVSGDTNALNSIGMPMQTLDFTDITELAHERQIGIRDGSISWISFFDDATGASHEALKAPGGADKTVMYFHRAAVGTPVAALVSKQLSYDGNRGQDGSFLFNVNCSANGYGLEWGRSLTAGKRTDTTGTNGTTYDAAASTAFGAQIYLEVFSVTGTSVTVTIQDSADGVSWANLADGAFAAASARGAQRLQTGRTATVRRYLRAVSSGTFTDAQFAVSVVKNKARVDF